MTTEDRQIWNEAKAEVVAELQANRERYREQYDAGFGHRSAYMGVCG